MEALQAPTYSWKSTITTQYNRPPLSVGFPLTCDVHIQKNITGKLNQASIKIYNLNSTFRKQIEFDRFKTQDAISVGGLSGNIPNPLYLPVSIDVGFLGQKLTTIFQGNMQSAYTTKEDTHLITTIEAVDGLYAINNSFAYFNIEEKTSSKEIIDLLFASIKNAGKGYISNVVEKAFPYGFSQNGRSIDRLQNIAAGDPQDPSTCADCFIDNNKIFILGKNEAIQSGRIPLFNATNILKTPRATADYISFDIVLNTSLNLGQFISLQSSINSFINGNYKIVGLEHRALISEERAGSCITTVQVYRPISHALIPVFYSL